MMQIHLLLSLSSEQTLSINIINWDVQYLAIHGLDSLE